MLNHTRDAHPFWGLFDAEWGLWRLDAEQVDLYLEERAEQGFDGIQMLIGLDAFGDAHNYRGIPPYRSSPIEFWVYTSPGSGVKYLPNINHEFWEHLDEIILRAAERGLYVALAPFWGREFDRAFAGDDGTKAYLMGRWLGQRYRQVSHLIWVVSGEFTASNGYVYPVTPSQKGLLDGFTQGLREGDRDTHLIAITPAAPWTSWQGFPGEGWLDFNTLPSGHGGGN
jgi:hypothetical protein